VNIAQAGALHNGPVSSRRGPRMAPAITVPRCRLSCCTGLTTAVAQRTLAAKAQSILQYHLLDGGGYTAAELLDNAALQSSLGRTLGTPLPLTFAAGRTSGSVGGQGSISVILRGTSCSIFLLRPQRSWVWRFCSIAPRV
jgi:hypothetical protein